MTKMAAKSACCRLMLRIACNLLLILVTIPMYVSTQTSPEITVWGTNNHRVVGQKLTLFCKVLNLEGYDYYVKWSKGFTLTDGTRVVYHDSGRVSVSKWSSETGDVIYVLVIANVKRSYEGTYTCQAVFTADAKISISESISIRVTKRTNSEILPSCSLNQNTKNTRYVAFTEGTLVNIMCVADTLHQNASLVWGYMSVYEQGRSNIESNMITENTYIRNTLEISLSSSHDGHVFICTLTPYGMGDKRHCTIGPVKVVPSISTAPSLLTTWLSATTGAFITSRSSLSSRTPVVITSQPDLVKGTVKIEQTTGYVTSAQTKTQENISESVTQEMTDIPRSAQVTKSLLATTTVPGEVGLTSRTASLLSSTLAINTESHRARKTTIVETTRDSVTSTQVKTSTHVKASEIIAVTQQVTIIPRSVQATRSTQTAATSVLDVATPINAFSTMSTLSSTSTDQDILTTNYGDNTQISISSAMSTMPSRALPFSESHTKLNSSIPVTTQRHMTILPISKTMTTQQTQNTTSMNKSTITKSGTPYVVMGKITHTPLITTETKVSSTQDIPIKTTKVDRNVNGYRISLNPTTSSAIIFSCIGFLVILFFIAICIGLFVKPAVDTSHTKTKQLQSFHLVDLLEREKPPSYHSRTSSSIEDTKFAFQGDTPFAEPYHVTDILTNLKKDLEVIYDNQNPNISGLAYHKRTSIEGSVVYDNKKPNSPDFCNPNETTEIDSQSLKSDTSSQECSVDFISEAGHQKHPNGISSNSHHHEPTNYCRKCRLKSNSRVIYDNCIPNTHDDKSKLFCSDDSSSNTSFEDVEHIYDNRNFHPDLVQNRRCYNTKYKANKQYLGEDGYSSIEVEDSQSECSKSSLSMKSNNSNLSQPINDRDSPLQTDNNEFERTSKGKTGTMCSVQIYADIKPLNMRENVRRAFEADGDVYKTSSTVALGTDDEFHVRRTCINNPLYNIDT